ncbi:MAG: class I SAM-dependent methyltransferase, partial [Verrucomicrobiota bacterium]
MSPTQPESILPPFADTDASSEVGSPSAERVDAPGRTQPRWIESVTLGLVTSLFGPMTQGHLRMVCPDGSCREFGAAGQTPAAEIRVRRWRFFTRCAAGGDMGFGEAYQAGDWETPDLAAVIAWFCANVDQAPSMSGSNRKRLRFALLNAANRIRHFLNRNTLTGSRANIAAHYDLGNAFYSHWLDATMTYSAALFESPDQSLEAAQTAKYERLCRELRLKAGEHL